MKVLITGGGGFIGSHLSEAHLQRGDEVWAIDTGMNLKVRHLLANPRFHYVKASVMDAEAMEALKTSLRNGLAATIEWFRKESEARPSLTSASMESGKGSGSSPTKK